MLVNIPLRPIGRTIDRKPLDEDSDIETTYRFFATTNDSSEADVRALLLRAISGPSPPG